MARLISALRLVHPFPSFLNSALVFALAALAGADNVRGAVLATAMLGMQFCIGTVNDVIDAPIDRTAKPWKPIGAGNVSRRAALVIALISGWGGFILAAIAGPLIALMWLAMLVCGLVYDVRLKPTPWAWLCFSMAFTILPIYAWYGAAGTLPPRPEFLLPLAFLAGPMIQLSNSLADVERDRAAGVPTLATRLGPRRSLVAVSALIVVINGLAWLTIAQLANLVPVAGATSVALVGLFLSASSQPARREVGWMVQAVAIALLAIAWVLAAD